MHTGVVKTTFKKTDLDQAIKEYKETALPAIATHQGARSAFLLLNRETGDAISVAMYEDETAAKSFAPKAEKLIASLKKYQAGNADGFQHLEGKKQIHGSQIVGGELGGGALELEQLHQQMPAGVAQE